jgi:predicted RNA binding protein YcfA (HicA-like mRNA interferase family)
MEVTQFCMTQSSAIFFDCNVRWMPFCGKEMGSQNLETPQTVCTWCWKEDLSGSDYSSLALCQSVSRQVKEGKAIPVTGREGHMGVRSRGSHIFQRVGSQMAVTLTALRPGRPLPQGKFLILVYVGGWVHPRAIVYQKGLNELKNPVTLSGFDPATFRHVA